MTASPRSPQATPVLQVDGLSVDFGRADDAVRIVDEVSFSLAAGETLGLVGESGCGKSTTVLALLRLLPPRVSARVSGTVKLNGDDLLRLPEKALPAVRGRGITMIPQNPMTSLNPLFTIGRQLEECLDGPGVSPARRRELAIEQLRAVGISEPERRLNQFPHELSGGMRQRVVGACVTARSPRVLIADEPTTALDATVQVQYLDMLKSLQARSGMAMLFVTHDIGVVARICDRIAVMYAGRIVESGKVDTVLRSPRHWYTRALIDSLPPLDRQLDRLPTIAGTLPRPGTITEACRFAPRCPAAHDKCRTDIPPAVTDTDGHVVACWTPREQGSGQ
ncbi:MAG: ABC transporter ATP-binding protein [Gammaproteobacteria bacterium]|nr:ABC transporter ATP-binding protein [Gammaproteobacteria bacterium]